MQHRDVYSPEYFEFVLRLVVSNMVGLAECVKDLNDTFETRSLQMLLF